MLGIDLKEKKEGRAEHQEYGNFIAWTSYQGENEKISKGAGDDNGEPDFSPRRHLAWVSQFLSPGRTRFKYFLGRFSFTVNFSGNI